MASDRTPIRVGVLLPFSNGLAATRSLAKGMMNAAELALFDAHNPDILLISGDEGSTPDQAASAARKLLDQGAEIIVGPVFAPSVSAVAPIARDHGVPIVSFSTDRRVAGDEVYLLSYQPGNEIRRIVSYAVHQGHVNFAAFIPRTAYGDRVAEALTEEATAEKVRIADVERFDAGQSDFSVQVTAVSASGADTVLIAQSGPTLKSIAAMLTSGTTHPQLLGTGIWEDKSNLGEPVLVGGWFAAPSPDADAAFSEKYKATFNSKAPQLAPLAYDAISLVAALAQGPIYHRFTQQALTDPNGFFGVSGIFRFNPDGTADRGLAILSVGEDDFQVVEPSPRTFQAPHS